MSAPGFVAEFDSATGLVRALAAALADEPHLRLGRSRPMAALVSASRALPEAARAAVFARAGAGEAIKPKALPEVEPERFSRWVVGQYPQRPYDAVAIGSSNGAVMHLCAAMGVPWLPQTFLVPVRRRSDPDDCIHDATLAADEAAALLAAQPALAIHQMHDPNQDRLMVRHIAYFRMKMRALSGAYRRYLSKTLAPGATILIVDGETRWPVTRRGPHHVYQQGAVGGLAPEEYVDGSPRVRQFLADQGAAIDRWRFPPVDERAPEAEWGYDQAMTADIRAFAARYGYRVARLRIESPDAAAPVIADTYRDWYAATGQPSTRLLVETFICAEPRWALATRTVPLWLTFGTEPSLDVFSKYLTEGHGFDDVAITLFPHGVRSAGYAPAERWQSVSRDHGVTPALAGVDPDKWPIDFAGLATYADELHRKVPPGERPKPLALADAADAIARFGPPHGVEWVWE
jgi:hypothetical protein